LKAATCLRILHDRYLSASVRQNYWNARAFVGEVGRLANSRNAGFRSHVLNDLAHYWFDALQPITGQIAERAAAAVGWLLRAQAVTPDDGVSLGWFPCAVDAAGWRPSYPETTGYIISSLLAYARRFGEARARAAALAMARWEIGIQMPSGAVQGGPVCSPDLQTPAAFNTGMVLEGWCSAYQDTPDSAILAAARRAADFLVADLDADGYFRTNGQFVQSGEIKTYTCLCAWPLHRFGALCGEHRYAAAAVRAVEAALRQQRPNGWFAQNSLLRSDAPLTHTLSYTLQGILEVGALTGRDDFISAVRRSVDHLLPRIRGDGYLPGMFYEDWEPACFSSCLTGSAQIAVVCYRLADLVQRHEYRDVADRLLDFLKPLQALAAPVDDANGALPGSFPIFGDYMRGGYPNWATKYLLDALLLQLDLRADPTTFERALASQAAAQ